MHLGKFKKKQQI